MYLIKNMFPEYIEDIYSAVKKKKKPRWAKDLIDLSPMTT
jgi:hypothetical protein